MSGSTKNYVVISYVRDERRSAQQVRESIDAQLAGKVVKVKKSDVPAGVGQQTMIALLSQVEIEALKAAESGVGVKYLRAEELERLSL